MEDNLQTVENASKKYKLIPIHGIAGYPSELRKLYKVAETNGGVHYKSFSFSLPRMKIENKKGKKLGDIVKIGEEIVKNHLREGNISSVEYVFHSDKNFIRKLNEKGEYQNE